MKFNLKSIIKLPFPQKSTKSYSKLSKKKFLWNLPKKRKFSLPSAFITVFPSTKKKNNHKLPSRKLSENSIKIIRKSPILLNNSLPKSAIHHFFCVVFFCSLPPKLNLAVLSKKSSRFSERSFKAFANSTPRNKWKSKFS